MPAGLRLKETVDRKAFNWANFHNNYIFHTLERLRNYVYSSSLVDIKYEILSNVLYLQCTVVWSTENETL